VIELTKSQIGQVVRTAGQGGTVSVLLSSLRDVDGVAWTYPQEMEDRRLSKSLLSGLLVLGCFPPDGRSLGVVEVAELAHMSPSTAFRYVATLLAAGLIEQDAATRKYRLAESQ
jgi:DNA-binding MarR family transcriptional regulator